MRAVVLGLGLATVLCAGCGPIQASSALYRADEAMREARARGWDTECPYEMAAAENYVSAARDLVGRSEFQAAEEFAERAARLASSTRDVAPRNALQRQARSKARKEAPAGSPPQPPSPAVKPQPVGTPGGRP